MRRMRTGLLVVLAVSFLGVTPVWAQEAPNMTGETGLFELVTADFLKSGQFALGLFYSQGDRSSAPSLLWPAGTELIRYGVGKLDGTITFGATDRWEFSLTAGQAYYYAEDRLWAGVINGRERAGGFRHSETDKVRLGTKYVLNPNEPLKVVLFGGYWIPTQAKSDNQAQTTYRADWDFGLSATYGIATFQAGYFLAGDMGEEADVPNQFRAGLGFNVPIIKHTMKGIFELNRIHFDGGTTKPDDYSEATAGVRFAFGKTGFVASGALRVNIDRWVKFGNSPSNLGGLVQVAWRPQPSEPETAKVVAPAPEPVPAYTPPSASTPAPAPMPAPAPVQVTETVPAPKPETSTTDEILFDPAKAKLTNIAKAILDGVALRLKNNLAASCTITAHTDSKEKGGDHMALARARADAAKDYLVKRHGIDAARITTTPKGDAEAGPDATRNRRAVVTVAFP